MEVNKSNLWIGVHQAGGLSEHHHRRDYEWDFSPEEPTLWPLEMYDAYPDDGMIQCFKQLNEFIRSDELAAAFDGELVSLEINLPKGLKYKDAKQAFDGQGFSRFDTFVSYLDVKNWPVGYAPGEAYEAHSSIGIQSGIEGQQVLRAKFDNGALSLAPEQAKDTLTLTFTDWDNAVMEKKVVEWVIPLPEGRSRETAEMMILPARDKPGVLTIRWVNHRVPEHEIHLLTRAHTRVYDEEAAKTHPQ